MCGGACQPYAGLHTLLVTSVQWDVTSKGPPRQVNDMRRGVVGVIVNRA